MARYRRYPRTPAYVPRANQGVQYINRYTPDVNPEIMMQTLGRRQQEFNLGKQLPEQLISQLNKANLPSASKPQLAEYYDKEINNIKKMVDEEYMGDWGAAKEEILSKINRLQIPLSQGQQRYKELQPKMNALWEARAKGKGVYGGKDLESLQNKGIFNFENGEPTLRNVNTSVEFYDESQMLDSIRKNVSTPINQSIKSLPPSIQDNLGFKVMKNGTIQGMDDKSVKRYLTENKYGKQVLKQGLANNRDFQLYAANKYGIEPEKVVNDPRVQDEFANVVASQTSARKRLKYNQVEEADGGGGTTPYANQHAIGLGYKIGELTNLENYGFDPNDVDFSSITEEAVEKDPKLKPQYEFKKEIDERVNNRISKYLDPENLNMSESFDDINDNSVLYGGTIDKFNKKDSELIKNVAMNVDYAPRLAEEGYNSLLGGVKDGDFKLNTPISEIKNSDLTGALFSLSDNYKKKLQSEGVKTVEDAIKMYKGLQHLNESSKIEVGSFDKEWPYFDYNMVFDEELENYTSTEGTKASNTGIFATDSDETENAVEFFKNNPDFLPEEIKDDDSKLEGFDKNNYSMNVAVKDKGPEITFINTNTNKKYKKNLSSMEPDAVKRLSSKMGMPLLYEHQQFANSYNYLDSEPIEPGFTFDKNEIEKAVNGNSKKLKKVGNLMIAKKEDPKRPGKFVYSVLGVKDGKLVTVWNSTKAPKQAYRNKPTAPYSAALFLQNRKTPYEEVLEDMITVKQTRSQELKAIKANLGIIDKTRQQYGN